MKINQLRAGSFLSYIQMALSILIGLIYTPLLIDLLGQNEYGLYSTVSSTISMLSILSLGFNSSYIRYYASYKKDYNIKAICKLNGMFLLLFLFIGVIAFVCGIFLSYNLDLVFAKGLTTEEYAIAKVLMTLLTISLTVSFPASVFSSIISAHEKFIYLKLVNIFRTVIGPILTIPFLLAGYKSIAVVALTVGISLVVDVCYFVYVVAKLRCKFTFRGLDKGLFRSLFKYTVFIAINMIIDQINWNVDKILLGRFCGTSMVAIYSVGYSLYHYYSLFSTSISGVFTPRIHKLMNDSTNQLERRVKLTEIFVKVGRIQFLVLALIASGICFFGKSFIINIWANKGYEDSYYVALLLILPATIALIQNLGIEIQRAQNKNQFRSVAYFFMALINLGLSFYLCQRYGAIGSAIGTSISLIVANGVVMNLYYHKKCNIDIIVFWKNIISISKGLIIPILLGFGLNYLFDYNKINNFFVCICVYSIGYFVSMWFLGMNKYEKDIVLNIIKKLKKQRG